VTLHRNTHPVPTAVFVFAVSLRLAAWSMHSFYRSDKFTGTNDVTHANRLMLLLDRYRETNGQYPVALTQIGTAMPPAACGFRKWHYTRRGDGSVELVATNNDPGYPGVTWVMSAGSVHGPVFGH
jgi:hypothetical protein